VSNQLYAQSCAISPADSNECYLTTEDSGLWFTSNLRSANPTFTQLYNILFSIRSEFSIILIIKAKFWIASFGNGIRKGAITPDSLNAIQDLTIFTDGTTNTLHWTAVQGASSYRIYGSLLGDFSDEQLLGTINNTTFQNPVSNLKYFYRIVAVE